MDPSLFERVVEFGRAFISNWWALVAGAVFIVSSIPQNLLSETAKEKLNNKISPEHRRVWLVRLAVVFLLVAAFQAYDGASSRLRVKEKELAEAIKARPIVKDRSKFIGPLQKYYAAGSGIQRALLSKSITDEQIDQAGVETTNWLNEVAGWIHANMSLAAASRFLNNSDKGSYSFNLDGNHQPGKKETRDNILNSLAGCLTNLETIMKSDQWDPQ